MGWKTGLLLMMLILQSLVEERLSADAEVFIGNSETKAADLPAARKAGLDHHNMYRRRHGAPPMVLDDYLNDKAQKWSEWQITKNNKEIKHSKAGYGENIALSITGSRNYTWRAIDATNGFYFELCDYDFKKGKFGWITGHFTQMIWKQTNRMGLGIASHGTTTITTVNYKPMGNIVHKTGKYFLASVKPPICPTEKEIRLGECPKDKKKRKKIRSDADCAKGVKLSADFDKDAGNYQAASLSILMTSLIILMVVRTTYV